MPCSAKSATLAADDGGKRGPSGLPPMARAYGRLRPAPTVEPDADAADARPSRSENDDVRPGEVPRGTVDA